MKKERAYDLHLHTTFSDGKSALKEVIGAAIANGMDCIAITDHIFPGADTRWIGEVRKASDAYRDEITILVGAEGVLLNPEGATSIDHAIRS